MASFAASWRLLALVAAAGATAGVATVLVDDPRSAVVLGAAAALLLGTALRGALLRPVLRAGPAGLEVRDGLRLVRVPWSAEVSVRVAPHRVRLVRASWLEVDAGDHLVLLHPSRLGRRAEDVAAEVARVRRSTPSD